MIETERQDKYLWIVERMAIIKREIINFEMRLAALRERRELAFRRIQLEVAQAMDERGKPIYRNEDLRRPAIIIKTSENEKIQSVDAEIRDIENQVALLRIEISRLADQKALLMAQLGINSQNSSEWVALRGVPNASGQVSQPEVQSLTLLLSMISDLALEFHTFVDILTQKGLVDQKELSQRVERARLENAKELDELS